MKKFVVYFRTPALTRREKREVRKRSAGFSLMEVIVALAILGLCALILGGGISRNKALRSSADLHARATAVLISRADLIRSGGASLSPGKHDFRALHLPKAAAYYEVSKTS